MFWFFFAALDQTVVLKDSSATSTTLLMLELISELSACKSVARWRFNSNTV